MPKRLFTCCWALLLAVLASHCSSRTADAAPADPRGALSQFSPGADVPEQREALLQFFNAVGTASELGQPNPALEGLGYAGNSSWGAPGTSYCWWWGVTCCGATLYFDLALCSHMNSVSGLEVAALGLKGRLPDLFQQLPDLQILSLDYNRGLRGPLPDSLGSLQRLWQLNIMGTAMRCSDTTQQPPPCPIPTWLVRQLDQHYYDRTSLECPVVTFAQPRQDAGQLSAIYAGAAQPEVFISDSYFNNTDESCLIPEPGLPGFFAINQGRPLAPGVLVAVILVPSLAVSAGLVLLSVALMRYLRYLKRSHDAIHLTEAWKRRNPPGLISDGNDRVLREVTLVITDVEGSTELWEWDYAVMTLAQEVHDSVMRSLIGRYCGYEVTTEGDSFTIAFHDAFDAVCWSLAMQQAMLEADWPDQLLTHDKAGVVYSNSKDSSRPGQLLFRGLRVRVAISTGIPSLVYSHELTNTLTYAGPVMDLASALSDLPAGGQILLGPQTFSSIAPRLAELGVRLMLTETEAAASSAAEQAAGASSHHPSQHADASAGRPPAGARTQSMLQRAASGAAALWGSGRRSALGPLPQGDEEDDSLHGGGAFDSTADLKASQQQHQSNAQSQLGHSCSAKEAALPQTLPCSSADQALRGSAPAATLHAANGMSSPGHLPGAAVAAGTAQQAQGAEGWWPGWLRLRGGSSATRGTSSISRRSRTSGGGHSSGGLSMHNSSSGMLVDSEKGLAGVHRNSVDKHTRPLYTESTAGAHNMQGMGVAIQDNEHIPMVIDLGSHWLDGLGNAVLGGGNPTAALQGVRLTQITTRQLSPRAAHFPPLSTSRQIYPSFFQAPSACEALLPDGLVFSSSRLPVVTIAFCAPDQAGLRAAEGASRRASKQALEMFCSAVRTTLNACNGYECQEKDGIFMVAFDDAASAVEWACLLNLALLCIHWAPEILASSGGKEVYGPTGELLYRGVRARVGIYKGEITRIIPHRATGRADYFGPPVNRAARFLAASAPGQVLAERTLVEECVELWCEDDLQVRLARRAALVAQSFSDSLSSRRLSNTSTIIGSAAAAADAAAASEAGESAAGLSHAQPVQSQSLSGVLSAQLSASHPPQQQQVVEQADSSAAAAPTAVVDADATRLSSSGGGAKKPPKSSFSFGLRQGAGAGGGAVSPDRQESCQLMLSGRGPLYEVQQQHDFPQQQLPDALQSRQQLQQQHDLGLRSRSQRALQQQQGDGQPLLPRQPSHPHAQQQQQLLQGGEGAWPGEHGFGSPFNSADKLPEPSASSVAAAEAAAAAAAAGAVDSAGSGDSVVLPSGWGSQGVGVAPAPALTGRESSSSTESVRMARQATLSAMLQLPSSAGTSRTGSGPEGSQLSAASSADAPAAAAAAPGTDGGAAKAAGGSSLTRLYRSSSSSGGKALPTLFEGEAAARGVLPPQSQQQGQLGQLAQSPGRHAEGGLSPAASSTAAASRAASDAGAMPSGSVRAPSARYSALDTSTPLREELYAGFEDASSADDSDAEAEGSRAHVDASAFMVSPDTAVLSAQGSPPATRRLRSMFNIHSSRHSLSSSGSIEEGPAGLPAVQQHRVSSTSSGLGVAKWGLGGPRALLRTFSTFAGGSTSSAAGASRQSGASSNVPSRMSTLHGDCLELAELRVGSSRRRPSITLGSGPSATTAAAALAAAVYRNDTLCRQVSETGGSLVLLRSSGGASAAAGAAGADAAAGGLSCRSGSSLPGSMAAKASTASSDLQDTPADGLLQAPAPAQQQQLGITQRPQHTQQQQQQQPLLPAVGDPQAAAAAAAAAGPPASRRLSWAGTGSSGAGAAAHPHWQQPPYPWEPSSSGLGASGGQRRRTSWAETGAASAAAAGVLQQQHAQHRRVPSGLYGLLQEVRSVPVSPPERQLLLEPPRGSLQDAAGTAAGLQQPLGDHQQHLRMQPQQQPVSPLVRQQHQRSGSNPEQGVPPRLSLDLPPQPRATPPHQQPPQQQQQQGSAPGGGEGRPALRIKVSSSSAVGSRGASPGPLSSKQPGSPGFCSSPTSSPSAFASAASVCWDQSAAAAGQQQAGQQQGSDAFDASLQPVDGQLGNPLQERASAPAASGAAAAAAAAGLQHSNSAAGRMQQPYKQRSLQEREQGEAGVRPGHVPRQLSMPPYVVPAPGAGGPAGAAGASSTAGLASSALGGSVFARQMSLYGGHQAPGELLTGALPLEALPGLRVGKLHRHQSFMLQAIKDQVSRSSVQRRVPMRLQVYDIGTWVFKGISGAHPVVVLLPSRLAGRMVHGAPVKKSSKALCVEPSEGLLHELWVEVVNMDTILLDPELLLSSGIGGQPGGLQYGQAGSGGVVMPPAGTPTAAPSTAASLAGAESGRVPGVGLDGGRESVMLY